MNNRKIGTDCEKLAFEYLEKNNFSIVNKNWRLSKFGEIDLVALDKSKKEIVFVEVKSQVNSSIDPKEQITRRKQKRLIHLANSYIHLNNLKNCSCRFDVIAIRVSKEVKSIEHIKNAF